VRLPCLANGEEFSPLQQYPHELPSRSCPILTHFSQIAKSAFSLESFGRRPVRSIRLAAASYSVASCRRQATSDALLKDAAIRRHFAASRRKRPGSRGKSFMCPENISRLAASVSGRTPIVCQRETPVCVSHRKRVRDQLIGPGTDRCAGVGRGKSRPACRSVETPKVSRHAPRRWRGIATCQDRCHASWLPGMH
jgi:hypothetical protein